MDSAIGVSANCLNGGFKTEEVINMMYTLGLEGSEVVSLDLCEINPCIEDWRTGRLVVTLFYYFVLGLAERKKRGWFNLIIYGKFFQTKIYWLND